MHGGEITAYSEGKDTGATFTVELPVVKYFNVVETVEQIEEREALEAEQASQSFVFNVGKVSIQNILVVDDAATNRKMMCR